MCNGHGEEIARVTSDAQVEDRGASEAFDATRAALEKQHERGANWFYWIAGLSVVNSITALAGAEFSFVIGLGITQFIDAVVLHFEGGLGAKLVAFGFDLIIAAFVAVFGYLAGRRLRWAYLIGMILYALDGLLFLLSGDVLSMGFHAFALWGIYGGFKACGHLRIPAVKPQPASAVFGSDIFAPYESACPNVPSRAVVWPVVIATMTFVYVILYGLLGIRNVSQYWRIASCLFMLAGAGGLLLKRKGGAKLVSCGALMIVGHIVYLFLSAAKALPEEAPAGAIFILLAILFLLALWPLFLIFWFLRARVRQHISREWV